MVTSNRVDAGVESKADDYRRAVATLAGMKLHVPDNPINEATVADYHEALRQAEHAVNANLDQWDIPRDRFYPIGASGKLHIPRAYFLMKLDGVLNYLVMNAPAGQAERVRRIGFPTPGQGQN